MIKICHLSSVHPAFDTRIFYKECKSLVKVYEVHLVIPHEIDEIVDGIHIHAIKNESNRFKRMLCSTFQVLQQAIHVDATLYHLHDPELLVVGILLKIWGKKVIFDAHEDYPAAILSKYWIHHILRRAIALIYIAIERFACNIFDGIITVHRDIANRMREYNFCCEIIYNFPLLICRPKNYNKVPQFVWLGGFSNIRGGKQLASAFAGTDEILHIIGPVKGKIFMESNFIVEGNFLLQEAYRKAESFFAGFVTYLPEPNHINALPNKLFEYMMLGIAVIASDFPKWKVIIDDTHCGLTVNPQNVDELRSAIQWMHTHYSETIQMGKNGRLAIEQKYNWTSEEKKLLAFYNKILYM